MNWSKPESFIEFDARNAIWSQIKVLDRKLKVTTLAWPFIKANARSSFARSIIIRWINIKIKNILQRLNCIYFRFNASWLSEMKELNQIILEKGLFASTFVSQQGNWAIQKGRWRMNPPNRIFFVFFCFWYVWLKLRKKLFFKKGTFNKASDLLTLCLSKIGLVSIRSFTEFANIKERNAIQKKKMQKKRTEISHSLQMLK